jgi:hypothetical protein
MIAEMAQPLKAFVNIKKSRLPAHRIASDPAPEKESETPLMR